MVAQSLPCPAYSGGGSKGGKVPGRREGSGEVGRGDVLVGRRHCKKVFQLLVLVPQAKVCGQQTRGSLERIPLLPAPPPPSSLWLGPGMTLWAAWPSPWPGFPFSILKFPSPCHQFCVWPRRVRLQPIFEVAGGRLPPASVSATCRRAGWVRGTFSQLQLWLFSKLP